MDGHPFWPVHVGRAHDIGRRACVNHHFGLGRETGVGSEPVFPLRQIDPLTGAVRVEARGIERAMVKDVLVLFIASSRYEGPHADKFVDMLEPRAEVVVAHVVDDAPVGSDRQGGVLVCHPPHGRVFDRRAGGIEGIDLHHPAVTVRLVGVSISVEARVELVPAVAPAFRVHPVAIEQTGNFAGIGR